MKRNIYLPALLTASVMVCVCSSASPKAAGERTREASEQNQAVVIDHLLPVLYSSGKAIRLNYHSDCRAATTAMPFPYTMVQAPEKGKQGIAAIQQIFEKDRNVSVRENASGIIEIQIGKRSPDVLQTKLSQLPLNGLQQYNPAEAFRALTSAKEMQTAMHSRQFESVWDLASTVVDPSERYSHLPPILRNVTAEQVLDQVARTWAGQIIVIYGVCAEPEGPNGPTRFWVGWAGQLAMKPLR